MLDPKTTRRAPAGLKPKPVAPPVKSADVPKPAAAQPVVVKPPVAKAVVAKSVPAPAPVVAPKVPEPQAVGASKDAAPAPVEAAPTPVADASPVPVSPPVVIDPIEEGQKIMATTFETAASPIDKFQGLLGDTQGRAKAAMEKGAKFYEELGDFTKGNVEAVMASSKLAASGMETIGQDAVAYGKRSLEHATTTFKSLSAVKSPTDLFQIQSDYAKAAFDAMVAEGSKLSEKLVKLAGEVAQPLSTRFAVAAEKIKTPAL